MYRILLICYGFLWCSFLHAEQTMAREKENPEMAEIRSILLKPEAEIDLANIKFQIDRRIDRAINSAVELNKLDKMMQDIQKLLPPHPTDTDKLEALQKYLYEPGAWNDYRPFRYDFTDPLGTKISNKLLSVYLENRTGNCVTMPLLVVILGQKLGLKMTLATAPLHMLVKFTDSATGKTINLEATSGAKPARDEWYRQHMPMTDASIAHGLYLRPLSQKETVALMATVLAENYFQKSEYEAVIAVSSLVLEYFPTEINSMLRIGSASYQLLQKNFLSKYGDITQIPTNEQMTYEALANNNRFWFAEAERLGWQEPESASEQEYLNAVHQKQISH